MTRRALLRTETTTIITQVADNILAHKIANKEPTHTEAEDARYDDAEDGKGGEYYEDVDEGILVENVPRGPRSGAKLTRTSKTVVCKAMTVGAEQSSLFNG